MDQMGEWVQDALDAIEYANGPVDSRLGRAARQERPPRAVQPEVPGDRQRERRPRLPRALTRCSTTPSRPSTRRSSSSPTSGAAIRRSDRPDIVDEHYYNNPEFFMQQAGKYDTYDRKGPKIFVGEYAVTAGLRPGQPARRDRRGGLHDRHGAQLRRGRHGRPTPRCSSTSTTSGGTRDLINFDSSRVYGLPSLLRAEDVQREPRRRGAAASTVDAPEIATGTPRAGRSASAPGSRRPSSRTSRSPAATRSSSPATSPTGPRAGSSWRRRLEGRGRRRSARAAMADERPRHRRRQDLDRLHLLAQGPQAGRGRGIPDPLPRPERARARPGGTSAAGATTRHAIEMGGVVSNEVNGQHRDRPLVRHPRRGQGKPRPVLPRRQADPRRHRHPDRQGPLRLRQPAWKQGGELILKVVNTSDTEQTADIQLKGIRKIGGPVTAVVLTSENATDENTLENPTRVAPVTKTLEVGGPLFTYPFKPNSLTVLRLAQVK